MKRHWTFHKLGQTLKHEQHWPVSDSFCRTAVTASAIYTTCDPDNQHLPSPLDNNVMPSAHAQLSCCMLLLVMASGLP